MGLNFFYNGITVPKLQINSHSHILITLLDTDFFTHKVQACNTFDGCFSFVGQLPTFITLISSIALFSSLHSQRGLRRTCSSSSWPECWSRCNAHCLACTGSRCIVWVSKEINAGFGRLPSRGKVGPAWKRKYDGSPTSTTDASKDKVIGDEK